MVRRALGLVMAFAVLTGTPVFAAVEKYEIDPSHSHIGFTVKHLVISKVPGKFNEYSGTILYDEADPSNSSVDVTIQAKSIDTGVPDRDNHLRNEDFFDVATYPTITFKSSRIEKRDDQIVAVGTLTMHGVSKEVEIPFTVTGKVKGMRGETRIGVEGGVTLNRQDYGVKWSKTIDGGGLVVSDDVKAEFSIEAVQK